MKFYSHLDLISAPLPYLALLCLCQCISLGVLKVFVVAKGFLVITQLCCESSMASEAAFFDHICQCDRARHKG